MKRFVVFGVVIAMIVFFTLPMMIFAEPGDNSTAEGPEDGQYEMEPNMGTNPDDSYADAPEESNGCDIEVYCIDETIGLTECTDAYEETDTDVSDELIANGVCADNAEAVEILSTTATGACNTTNQDVIWEILNDNDSLDPVGQEVMDAAIALAQEYNCGVIDPLSPYFGKTLQEFLDMKEINDIDVELDETPFIEPDGTTNNEFTATAIMENPLVPGVTDGCEALETLEPNTIALDTVQPVECGKDVFWYILEGSYNVSFSQTDLVTKTKSDMFDYADDASDVDEDGLTDADSDHYGMATTPYYFYWWGDGFPEFEEMNVVIGACVDIDNDCKIDKEKGEDLDEFNAEANVVKTIDNPEWVEASSEQGPYNSEHMVEIIKDGEGDPIIDPVSKVPEVETYVPCRVDVDYYNAGKIIAAQGYRSRIDCEPSVYKDVYIDGHFTCREWDKGWGFSLCGHWIQVIPAHWDYSGWVCGTWVNGAPSVTKPAGYYGTCPTWQDCETVYPCAYYQRFVIESYSEPCDGEEMLYSRWLDFNVNKTDSEDPDDPVEGATYKLTYMSGRTSPNSYPYETEFTEITDGNGVAAFTGLPWGFYELTEEDAPDGYLVHEGSYAVGIGGDIFFKANQQGLPETYGYIDVTDDPIGHHDDPIPEPEDEGTITVAGLTEGIQVLAFTGLDPIIPISGAGALMGGLGLLIASLKTRRNKKS